MSTTVPAELKEKQNPPMQKRRGSSITVKVVFLSLLGINLFWICWILPFALQGRSLHLPALLVGILLSVLLLLLFTGVFLRLRRMHISETGKVQKHRLDTALAEIDQQNSLLKDVQKMTRVGYWFYDHHSGSLEWSAETYHIMDWKEQEPPNSSEFIALIHPADRPKLFECTERVVLEEQPYELEYRVITPAGKTKYCREFGRPRYDTSGKLVGIYGAVQDVTEQAQAEIALRENDERWRWIVQGTHDGVWDWDLNADTVYYSPQWLAQFGYEEGELSNSPLAWRELTHPDDLERATKVTVDHLEGNTPTYSCELRMRHKDGSYRWLLVRGIAIRDGRGCPYRMVGILTNIAEAKQAQEQLLEAQEHLEKQVAERTKALQEREHFLHLLIENIPLYLFWKDRNGAYLGCNSNYLKAHYFESADALIGKTDAELYAETDLIRESQKTDRQVLEEGKPVLHKTLPFSEPHAYLRWIDLNKTPIFNDEGQVIGILGYFENVTERRLATDKIEEQRVLLQKVIDTDPNLIYVTTQEGVFTLTNLATAEFFGVEPDALLGKKEADLLALGNDPSLLALRIAMETLQETYIPECRVITPRGEERWLQIIKRPLLHASGETPQILGIATDITARKRIEEDLLRAKVSAEVANQAKSQLISSMSHELRTPLNAVLGFSELLADEEVGPLNPRQQRYADNILTSGKQLLRLINDVLDLAKLDARKLELDYSVFLPQDALDNALSLVKQAAMDKKITFETHYLDPIPPISADQQRFKQILYTLLGNAIKLTSEKGKIEIEVSLSQPDDSCIHFAVQNRGIGIRPEDLKRIFYETEPLEPTEKHKYTGIRIGLALTRRLAEAHGGHIWAESLALEEGSIFHVEIPLYGQGYALSKREAEGQSAL